MQYSTLYQSPIGPIQLIEKDGKITNLSFLSNEDERNDIPSKETAILKKAKQELEEYFDGKRKEFDLPLSFSGTPFQEKVWNTLCTIPYGQTKSYQEIAIQVGSPKACRAIGLTNHINPIGIFVPCHRVVGKNGKLVGYAGGIDKKSYLLDLEKQNL